MIYRKDIIELVEAHQDDLTNDDLLAISFLCECIAQDRMRMIEENKEDFYG